MTRTRSAACPALLALAVVLATACTAQPPPESASATASPVVGGTGSPDAGDASTSAATAVGAPLTMLAHPDMCMDVTASGTANGTPVQLWGCNGTDAQAWTYSGGTLRAFGKCLDLPDGVPTNGTKLRLWDCLPGAPGQQWRTFGSALVYAGSGACVDLPGDVATPGAPLQIWGCNATDAQAWSSPRSDGTPVPPVFEPCPSAGQPCVVMPLGDSITWGVSPGGYRVPLLERAWADGRSITFVGDVHNGPATVDGRPFPSGCEGFPGYTIDTTTTGQAGIAPLVPAALAKYAPNIVTLMIGTNDVNDTYDLANAPARLGALLDTITSASPDALVVVARITPTAFDDDRVEPYNAAMPAVVAPRVAAGKHIVLVDMYGAFTADPTWPKDYLADFLHPSPAGYAVMADVWYAAIRPYLR